MLRQHLFHSAIVASIGRGLMARRGVNLLSDNHDQRWQGNDPTAVTAKKTKPLTGQFNNDNVGHGTER